ncbi:MAG: hypothetical protein V1708_02300 [Candidatus Micrarchaeota archaeon]
MQPRLMALLVGLAAFATMSAADVIYLHCPTIFTKSVSKIQANYFKNTSVGGGPLPACDGLNVTIDGRPPISQVCERPGLVSFNLSTPVAKTYSIEGVSSMSSPWNGDGTTSNCTVRRSSFNVSITIPDIGLAALPFAAVASMAIAFRYRTLKTRKGREPPKRFKA